jgi:hypothetical protein
MAGKILKFPAKNGTLQSCNLQFLAGRFKYFSRHELLKKIKDD